MEERYNRQFAINLYQSTNKPITEIFVPMSISTTNCIVSVIKYAVLIGCNDKPECSMDGVSRRYDDLDAHRRSYVRRVCVRLCCFCFYKRFV